MISGPSRRDALKLFGAAALTGPHLFAQTPAAPSPQSATTPPPSFALSPAQDAFLDDLTRRGCQFFWEQGSAVTGQVLDRARASGTETRRNSSIAATGFGLTALCIADLHGYLPAADIRQRVLATLDYHVNKLPNVHGFFYHFNDSVTGARIGHCELSSIDTAMLLCGALTARSHFTGPGIESQIRELATSLYNRVDFTWMLAGSGTLCMGWKPESGFLANHWVTYSELMMLYLLAIGSPTHAIPPTAWNMFHRPYTDYAGFHYISDRAPLFIHQYSHAWFDFRYRHDAFADYFANSILATRAHKAFCLSIKGIYTEDYWGISASDSASGYHAWGGPPSMGPIDGTVVPCAAAGSLPFVPADCLHVLMAMQQKYGRYAWGRYGFCDAFHPAAQWYDPDILGIDQGISVLMAENLRSAFVWQTFMRNPEPASAMQAVGFHSLT